MDALATDIANGQGETVDTLAVMMEVEDKAAFVAKLQANFDKIYTADSVSSADCQAPPADRRWSAPARAVRPGPPPRRYPSGSTHPSAISQFVSARPTTRRYRSSTRWC